MLKREIFGYGLLIFAVILGPTGISELLAYLLAVIGLLVLVTSNPV